MDYKNKYNEALERAREMSKTITGANYEYIFPELKETEDELTWLKNYISEEAYCLSMDIRGNEDRIKLQKLQKSLAWLEKQSEQKELNLVEILKHYPRETELYSPLYGKLWLAEVDEENEIITCYKYPLNEGCTRATLEQENTVSFYSNGTTGLPDYTISKDCMLFLYNKNKSEQKLIEKYNITGIKSKHAEGKLGEMIKKMEFVDKTEPKFKVGDWITDGHLHCKISDVLDDRYIVDTKFAKRSAITFEREHNYHLWTIADAKDGDVLVESKEGVILMFRGIGNTKWDDVIDYHCYYSCNLKAFCVKKGVEYCGNTNDSELKPATKEQRELLFSKMKDAGYKWDSEQKQLITLNHFVDNNDMVEPKFKVGDIVQYITDSTDRRKIEEVDTLCNMYHTDSSPIMFEIEDEWKVVVNAEDVEYNPTDKVEPKFEDGDWIVYRDAV